MTTVVFLSKMMIATTVGGYASDEYRPPSGRSRGGMRGGMYGVSFDSDEEDEDYEQYEDDSDNEDFDPSEGRRRHSESGEWEEIPAHLLQEPPSSNPPNKEEYMQTHPEREAGMSELVGMGFDASAVWDALETTNDNVPLAIDVLTANG